MSHVKICRICGLRDAKYICRECGREICEYDFDPYNWLCTDCISKAKDLREPIYVEVDNGFKTFILIFLAFLLISFGFFLIAAGSIGDFRTITIVFPFIFTTDPFVGLIAFAITIIIFIIIMYIFLFRIPRKLMD